MHSKIHLGLIAGAGVIALTTCIALPAQAQSSRGTPITDQYGATGTSPNASTWLEAINEQYGLPTATPVTDQYGLPKESNVSVWAEALRGQYKIAQVPTPVTDEYGATGTSPNSSTWYERMKEQYKIGT
jgi:hypothetical protein